MSDENPLDPHGFFSAVEKRIRLRNREIWLRGPEAEPERLKIQQELEQAWREASVAGRELVNSMADAGGDDLSTRKLLDVVENPISVSHLEKTYRERKTEIESALARLRRQGQKANAGDATKPPAERGAEAVTGGAGKRRKVLTPKKWEFQAYNAHKLGFKQEEVAREIQKRLKQSCNQSQVSRAVAKVEAFLKAEGAMPSALDDGDPPRVTTMDPHSLGLGRRTDTRVNRKK